MVADLRKMQENQGVSENRIDKYGLLRKARPDHLDEGADMGLFFVQ